MEDNEWETIQPSVSASQSDEDDGDAVVVTRPINFHEGFSVFPPPPQDDHRPQESFPETPTSPSAYSSSSPPSSVEADLPHPNEARNTLLKASLGILSSWVLRIANGFRSRIGFLSIASVVAFVSVLAYARLWRRWRRLAAKDNTHQLLLLINQKDEKIKQLLFQIDRMNEALSGRRKVPVFRVVVDSPLVIGPRANWKPT